MSQQIEVCLNLFPVQQLDTEKRTVNVYSYQFSSPPDRDDTYRSIGKILWNIGLLPAARLDGTIVTYGQIAESRLQNDDWTLRLIEDRRILDPANSAERKILEQLYRQSLYQSLRRIKQGHIEKSGKHLIWWDETKVEQIGQGWQVLKGALIDIVVDQEGWLKLEIDSHYRFHSPWTLHQWMARHPDVPINYLRNVSSDYSWWFDEVSEESPEEVMISDLGKRLADYHRDKGVLESVIQQSSVVYVRPTRKGKERERVPHLSQLLRPSVSMEILSFVAERGDSNAKQVLTKVKKTVSERLQKGQVLGKWIINKVYGKEIDNLAPERRNAILFTAQPLLARNGTVKRPKQVIQQGCLSVGETKFGCLNLLMNGEGWPQLIVEQLQSTAAASNVTVELNSLWHYCNLPNSDIERRRFWSDIVQQQGIKTMLVVSEMLGNERKTQLRREALQAGIALQFMLPMVRPDEYRAANITLGLLVKAGWQTVGMKMPEHPKATELTIGFDAGTNKKLFYGTSAFAVLADGQSLGWEIPEAQAGERFSDQTIWEAILSILDRFHQLNNRNPTRILLLRDGFVRDKEFDLAIGHLEKEGIAIDLLEVHKSGAGRMALPLALEFSEVKPGTGFSVAEDAFRIVTSTAKGGGSARSLEVVRRHGDAPLPLLANEIFSLSQLHPSSAFTPSRLPMPIHHADKMSKEIQRIGQLNILHGVDRRKLFAA